ncbi:class I SAM-dependent methyltransferase [Undibacterium parvum]|uniref:Class I SAM-dependent methyltransferase n=1 Tax=Undibacterium parvum TaxID=401471 RepID=A0A3Q9BPX8_9BURK|nr:SAM-dependent methyltransferase [Undibacterium parvum]AZP11839.1 class I SAM-dependent methyltransferase [Undibacterium parvum]
MRLLNPTPNNKLSLPVPSADAQAASEALRQVICAEIAANAGAISFARYMELALYAPQLGYYSGGAIKLGKDGDFTTSPEMSALFGATLARVCAKLFPQTSANIMEFGAGSGRLAFDFLTECQTSGIALERYFIVELSGELRARQEELLKDFPQVLWLQTMPGAFSGVVLGNEVLDAMPVALVQKTGQGWSELDVVLDAQGDFVSQASRQAAAQLVAQIPDAENFAPGYTTEVHAVAIGFMHSVAQMLQAGHSQNGKAGLAIWFDYGFPAHEYYLDQRIQGTLMCHYRHHAHPDPFYLPGLQDITAHVDFTAIARAALESGLELLAYTSQAGFLLEAGIGEILLRTPVEDPQRYLPAANALQKLVSPAEMGELFKVLVLGCGAQLPAELQRHDRRHRL